MSINPQSVRIAVIILLQIITILGLTIQKETQIATGQSIFVKLAPLDPRSLLQGDYVILDYEIANQALAALDKGAPELLQPKWFFNKVKVVLKSDGPLHTFKEVHPWHASPTLLPGEIILNAKVYTPHEILFGIENVFVPEGTGLSVEENAKFAELKIASNGNALITQLLDTLPSTP